MGVTRTSIKSAIMLKRVIDFICFPFLLEAEVQCRNIEWVLKDDGIRRLTGFITEILQLDEDALGRFTRMFIALPKT